MKCINIFLLFLFLTLSGYSYHFQGALARTPAKPPSGSSKYSELDLVDHTTTDTDVSEHSYNHDSRPSFDARGLNTSAILNKFGLNIVPKFTQLLDQADKQFSAYTQEEHFQVINLVLAALKDSFLKTLHPLQHSSSQRPTGSLEPETINELFDVQEKHFHKILKEDLEHYDLSHMSHELDPFFQEYIGHFFKSMKESYANIYHNGVSLNWTLLFLIVPFIERLPTDVVERDMFSDLLDIPGQLKQKLHDFLEDIMSGNQAHFLDTLLKMIGLKDEL